MAQTQQVSLSDIESVDKSDLSESRLKTLLNGYSSFEEVLNSKSDPIALDRRSGKPYSITDGRHRIYLARQKGYSSVPVIFVQFIWANHLRCALGFEKACKCDPRS